MLFITLKGGEYAMDVLNRFPEKKSAPQETKLEASQIAPMLPFKIPHKNANVWYVDKRYPNNGKILNGS
jgi:hypothetical protein